MGTVELLEAAHRANDGERTGVQAASVNANKGKDEKAKLHPSRRAFLHTGRVHPHCSHGDIQ